MKNFYINFLFYIAIILNVYAAEPVQDSLIDAKAEQNRLVSDIVEKESALIKYECAINIQKAIYKLSPGNQNNQTGGTGKAMMVDCLSGHAALVDCNKNTASEITEESRNCITNMKSRYMDENTNLSYPQLAERFTAKSEDITWFVSDIINVDFTRLSEIIDKETGQ